MTADSLLYTVERYASHELVWRLQSTLNSCTRFTRQKQAQPNTLWTADSWLANAAAPDWLHGWQHVRRVRIRHLSIDGRGAWTQASAVASGYVLVFPTWIYFDLCYLSFSLRLDLRLRQELNEPWVTISQYLIRKGIFISKIVIFPFLRHLSRINDPRKSHPCYTNRPFGAHSPGVQDELKLNSHDLV